MHARAEVTLICITAIIGITGCHKQAPVTQPLPAPPPVTQAARQQAAPTSAPVMTNAGTTAPANNASATALSEMIHFDYEVATLRSVDTQALDRKATILRKNPALRIRITGYCDERGSDEYNIALGMRRAMAAKEYLIVQGVDAARIDVASLGREMPLDRSETPEGWAINRRDEFVTVGASSMGTH